MSATTRATLAALSLAATLAGAQPPTPPSPEKPLAPFGWFAELSGSCWKGEYPDGATSDTQCYLAQYELLMRGSVKGVVTQAGIPRTTFEGDAVFAWDARKGRVVFTQWGTGGTYGTGDFAVEGEALIFRNFLSDGSESPVRSVWRRASPDGFRVVRERKGDSGWKETLAVDYKRVR